MNTRTKEAVRYLGYGRNAIDERTLGLVQECFAELDEIVDVRFVYRIFELFHKDNETLEIEQRTIQSKHLSKNLKGCDKVITLAITLGSNVDREMRKHEVCHMSKAVVFQACAAAYLEEVCDQTQHQILLQMEKEGLYGRPRFSPGYGDFSIFHQKDVLELTNAAKIIGLSMTDGYMLTPTKSVTALIGLSRKKEPCHQKGCEACQKIDCIYRRN